MDLRQTLNLPNADFTIPMKANLPSLEPSVLARWNELGIYHLIQEARRGAPAFVLHDGPPYTNGPIHLGTALNKILKDFVLKSRTLMGYRAPYVPGYDNHGLPIEQAVTKKFAAKKESPDVVAFRKACREHATEWLQVQSEQFQRLGVFGLWERPYATMDFRFEAEIIRVFKRLVERGYVYKGLRPTLWSPTSRTALADTEIVYQEHVSKAIFVRFPLREDPNRMFEDVPNLHTLIWTTTPWTIPANLAVAFHPELEYVGVKPAGGDATYLVAEALLPRLAETLGWANVQVLKRLQGINIDKAIFRHPIFDRDSMAVMAGYVTTDEGTGVVHTAPGHGREDFYTGVEHGLPILCPVDERGVLTDEAGEFSGVFYKDCDRVVVDRLRELGHLLHVSDYAHSYPHAERDGQPVIFRATEQWFVGIDHESLRRKMMGEIEQVQWFPAGGQNRIEAMIANRPDWCISRQRPWGVGIPVFYGSSSREPVLDPVAIESVAQLVEREGSDAWFAKDPAEILPPGYRHPQTGETEFTKETDVLDVWFDSGSTSLAVLEGNVEPRWKESWPADLYLEGSDQHRGWFNSSLILGTAIKDGAPYRQVVTHGFIIDETGIKMSKRLGNAIEPEDVARQYGIDVLRYWVASVDYANDVPCSDALLKQMGEAYRRVRNTLRFLLGNLYDFTPGPILSEGGDEEYIEELDQWVIERVDLLTADCLDAYARYDFGFVINAIHNFCGEDLSAFYLDAIKDRMYCDGKDWPSRRSGQAACHYVLVRLVKLLAPILCFTAEETYQKIPMAVKLESVHLETLEAPSQQRLTMIRGSEREARFAELLDTRSGLFAAFERWKAESNVKDSQDVVATLTLAGNDYRLVRSFSDEELALLFKMSWVELSEGPESYKFRPSVYPVCQRSRLRRPDVAEVDGMFLTTRDRRVLGL
ncbi:MAG TPA: isoleucine--tRNA ligase [Fimbriimonadaceae bacterium]|nr:isoleucine--tRNA ligase [Fimbriimonadaceae bacterium]